MPDEPQRYVLGVGYMPGKNPAITKGTWMIGAILSPKAWQAHLDGHLTGWSLQGTARRRRVRAE